MATNVITFNPANVGVLPGQTIKLAFQEAFNIKGDSKLIELANGSRMWIGKSLFQTEKGHWYEVVNCADQLIAEDIQIGTVVEEIED